MPRTLEVVCTDWDPERDMLDLHYSSAVPDGPRPRSEVAVGRRQRVSFSE